MTPPSPYRPIRQDNLREVLHATWPSLAPALALLVVYLLAVGF
jgi:hypothetical protein